MASNKGRRGRPPKRSVGIPELLIPKTPEMKLEEAKESIMEKMLDPQNVSSEKMPSFANLDSYVGVMDGSVQEGRTTPEPVAPEPPSPKDDPDFEIEDNGDVVEIEPEAPTYVEIEPPKPKPKTNNFENLKVYNKIKAEKDELRDQLETAESELEDVKKQLDAALSEKNALSEKVSRLEASLKKASEKAKESVSRAEFDKISEENDNLLLKNSELELENSILKESSTKKACEIATQKFTYSPPGYSKPQVPIQNTRPSMNGYEDWV